MNSFEKLLAKPSSEIQEDIKGLFEKFNLRENPFPSTPVVSKDASDDRIKGKIFEMEIRRKEYEQIVNNFIRVPRNDPGHLRMGFIMDTSYTGRGNGKSAFLINLHRKINEGFALDISNNINKSFSVYLSPEPGGRTKTFGQLVELFFESILDSNIIKNCLAGIRLEALLSLIPDFDPSEHFKDESDLMEKLNSSEWLNENNINPVNLNKKILENKYLISLPKEFSLYKTKGSLLTAEVVTQDHFKEYYLNLKKGQERLEFIFSHLVDFFLAANFNGAYVLVDDFERIPAFQSARQKRDFALELRKCLYDGLYKNARLGFYTFILALHAGVPRLIQEAWSDSGMENRVPITTSRTINKHIIPFEKLDREHTVLLLKRYLSAYRINVNDKRVRTNELFPFTKDAVYKIAEVSEFNASKILKLSYDLLDKASTIDKQEKIDEKFVEEIIDKKIMDSETKKSIASAETTDLLKKAQGD